MKTKLTILAATATCLCLTHSASAFTAVTTASAEFNIPGTTPGAVVGEGFSVPDGSFSSYTPGAGDPTITLGDLGEYQFTLSGVVTSVNPVTEVVDYTGTYRIFYAAGNETFSAGTLTLQADFDSANPYAVTGYLEQTQGAPAGFTGFTEGGAYFSGTYDQTSVAGGFIQGTLTSTEVAPDATSTMALLGAGSAGLLAFQRRFRK